MKSLMGPWMSRVFSKSGYFSILSQILGIHCYRMNEAPGARVQDVAPLGKRTSLIHNFNVLNIIRIYKFFTFFSLNLEPVFIYIYYLPTIFVPNDPVEILQFFPIYLLIISCVMPITPFLFLIFNCTVLTISRWCGMIIKNNINNGIYMAIHVDEFKQPSPPIFHLLVSFPKLKPFIELLTATIFNYCFTCSIHQEITMIILK